MGAKNSQWKRWTKGNTRKVKNKTLGPPTEGPVPGPLVQKDKKGGASTRDGGAVPKKGGISKEAKQRRKTRKERKENTVFGLRLNKKTCLNDLNGKKNAWAKKRNKTHAHLDLGKTKRGVPIQQKVQAR